MSMWRSKPWIPASQRTAVEAVDKIEHSAAPMTSLRNRLPRGSGSRLKFTPRLSAYSASGFSGRCSPGRMTSSMAASAFEGSMRVAGMKCVPPVTM